jgi:aryl-alcohol dehydrogenase-like predicted oxidoreductase
MTQRTIGDQKLLGLGLGCMPLSVTPGHPERPAAIRVIHAALDAGIRLLDTADAYTPNGVMGHNETMVAEAVARWPGDADDVLIATKGGHLRTNTGDWEVDGRPQSLRDACDASLRRLGVEAIGLYQHHRPDPDVPYAETLGAMAELHAAGKIRLVGVSNVDPGQIQRAYDSLPLASVQNEFSPRFRSSEPELELCAKLGVAFLPWSPFGGMGDAAALGTKHPAFATVAQSHGITPQQVCLAWMLAKADVVIPIPGSSRVETVLASVAALDVQLTVDELALLG